MRNLKVAVLTFYNKEGRFLFNHRKDCFRPDEDVWEFIGGGIDGSEEPIDTIKREVLEELNYKIDEEADKLEFVQNFEITGDNYVAKVYFYKAKFPGFDKFSDTEEAKVSDLKFFLVKEALALPLLPIPREILLFHASATA